MQGTYEPHASSTAGPSRTLLYSLSLAPSTASSSLWSDASSQYSEDAASSAPTSESDSCDSYYFSRPPALSISSSGFDSPLKPISQLSSQTSVSSLGSTCESAIKPRDPWACNQIRAPAQVELPSELRQNPRRTCTSTISRTGRPPALVRQADRKVSFVDNLVDTSTHIVEAVWPTSSVVPRCDNGNNAVLPLRTFIQETLRRSRTSYSTLQVALYYLILIKPHVPAHDFTMEQPSGCHASQAIQCGRRMFLAALILASKYLQDRNYSARAWSKISGLNTLEINQNEMTFLLAVNWKLHVTEEIYKRWADCVAKLTPMQPPSPGGAAQQLYERQCNDFRRFILNLSPELDNLEELAPWSPSLPSPPRSLSLVGAQLCAPPLHTQSQEVPSWSYTPPTERACSAFGSDGEPASVSKLHGLPAVMEPALSMAHAAGRPAPALGLLPTPRLTPQSSGFSTPAASVTSHVLGRSSSMGFAIAQASASVATQCHFPDATEIARRACPRQSPGQASSSHKCADRWPQLAGRWPSSPTSSPMSQLTRRPSLANSISTASSPESMISDSSRISRSSSISSASSVNAPSTKLDVQARCRYAKLGSERLSLRPAIASVPEDHEKNCLTASPESYAAHFGKEVCDMYMDLPLARRQREMDEAARALQELQRSGASRPEAQADTGSVKTGSKRSRQNSVHDDVREMLAGHCLSGSSWPVTMLRTRGELAGQSRQTPVYAATRGNKRVCCSTEAARSLSISSLHPAVGGPGGPGMWEGILN
ncbi:hypothetical protein VTK56DRAFT_7734 [Thermocarpiscus australiensis]